MRRFFLTAFAATALVLAVVFAVVLATPGASYSLNLLSPATYPRLNYRREAYFKKAYDLYARGDYKRAAALFGLYGEKGRLLRDYALYFRGICFFELKNYRKANYIFLKLAENAPGFAFYKNVIFYLASSEEKNGRLIPEISHFRYIARHAGKSSLRSYAMFKVYKAYLKLKEAGRADAYLRRLYADYPYFSKKHGIRLNPDVLTESQKIKRGLNLYYDSDYSESLSLLRGLDGRNREASFIVLRDFMKLNNPLFLKNAEECLSGGGQNASNSCYARYGVKNIKILDMEAYYYYYVARDYDKTLNILNYTAGKYGYLDERSSHMYRVVAWSRVLGRLKKDDFAGAAKTVKAFLAVNDNVNAENARFLFWYGVSLEKLGFRRRASFYFNLLKGSRELRYSYYGVMSAAMLQNSGGSAGLSPADGAGYIKIGGSGGATPGPGFDRTDMAVSAVEFRKYMEKNGKLEDSFLRFKAFLNLKLYYLADLSLYGFVGEADRSLPAGMKPGGSGMVTAALTYMLDGSGNYGMAVGLASYLTGNYKYRYLLLRRRFLEMLYPRPYFGYVRKYAFHYGVPMDLIYGVMRQESLYNPSCYSSASAIGLMQIIPSTGYYIAGRTGCNGFRPSMLYIKKINISFGSYYLKTLLDRFYNRKYLAIASYNAGPGAVSYWKNHLLRNDRMLLFIEFIPVYQTRNYVKKVLANYYVYDSLYGK